WSCTARKVDIYAPSTTLTSGNARYSTWGSVTLGTLVDQVNTAHGYTGCANAGVAFNVLTPVKADVTAHKTTQTFLPKADDETDTLAWKEFLPSSAPLAIQYNNPPAMPTNLSTSPTTSCTSLLPVGDGPVTLKAPVSDTDGGSVNAVFKLWKTSTPGTLLNNAT